MYVQLLTVLFLIVGVFVVLGYYLRYCSCWRVARWGTVITGATVPVSGRFGEALLLLALLFLLVGVLRRLYCY